jgi:Transglycosylase SLT domain
MRRPTGGVRLGFVLSLLVIGAPLPAPAQTAATAGPADDQRFEICQIMESAARANALPVDFFARVIWQESRFQADEIGPVTRSGARAQGIAQFMPSTAMERKLSEPFNPAEALPKASEFLAELRNEFGNLGLAAAAYNAGPQRVRDFLAGSRGLPSETRDYVLAITGRTIEDWTTATTALPNAGDNSEPKGEPDALNCHDLVATLEQSSNSLVTQWQGRKVPSWCKGLHHPNVSVCGPVHLRELVLNVASAMISRSHVHLSR